jgi:hemolysin III
MVAVPLVHDPIVARRLLVRVWMTALSGAAKTWLWPNSPRFLSALTYVAMGWSALPYLPMLTAAVDSHVVMLVSLPILVQSTLQHTQQSNVLQLSDT